MKTITGNISAFFKQLLNSYQICELCLQPTNQSLFICQLCQEQLPSLHSPCSQCSEELFNSSIAHQRCGQCQTNPPAFDYTICQYRYQPPVSHWILKMKDKRQFIWAEKIAALMIANPPTSLENVDCLTFIPSHNTRLLYRGFNPAELLAQTISHHFKIPLKADLLIKTGGKDQRQLNRQQRRTNLRKSLSSTHANLSGQHILIIDDVMTTGATLEVAASLLKQQGAGLVGAWTFARTPKLNKSTPFPAY